jgi:cobalt-zinc-cadmium efflux system protein
MAECCGHHGHSHNHAAGLTGFRLPLALGLTGAFVLIEAAAGFMSHSLALLSDAGHNLTDALALALTWYALVAARRPATSTKTYGYHRVGILTALLNSVVLLAISAIIFIEAIRLLARPRPVDSGLMIVVAALALFLNTVIAAWLQHGAHEDINVRSAFVHMLGDAMSAAGVLVAAVAIRFTHWSYADPLVSILIGAFIAYSAWSIVMETVNILLEGTPKGMDVGALAGAVGAVPGVYEVHDLHVWTIADGMHALSCHITVDESMAPEAASVVRSVKAMLAADYMVMHSTIETECGGCISPDLYCSMQVAKDEGTKG